MLVNHANGYIEENVENKLLIFDSQMKIKRYEKNKMMFLMGSKTKSKKNVVFNVIMKKISLKLNLILMITYH